MSAYSLPKEEFKLSWTTQKPENEFPQVVFCFSKFKDTSTILGKISIKFNLQLCQGMCMCMVDFSQYIQFSFRKLAQPFLTIYSMVKNATAT